jgi:hypothetical protein
VTESVFDDRNRRPAARDLARVLGPRLELWQALVALPGEVCTPVTGTWSYYKVSTGWILLLQRRTRTICTVIPMKRQFDVIFIFPERAVAEARRARLPRAVLESIEAATPYKVGRPFRVTVRRRTDLPRIRKLVTLKVGSW